MKWVCHIILGYASKIPQPLRGLFALPWRCLGGGLLNLDKTCANRHLVVKMHNCAPSTLWVCHAVHYYTFKGFHFDALL